MNVASFYAVSAGETKQAKNDRLCFRSVLIFPRKPQILGREGIQSCDHAKAVGGKGYAGEEKTQRGAEMTINFNAKHRECQLHPFTYFTKC